MKAFALAAGRRAAVAGTAVAGTAVASQSSVQARELVQQAEPRQVSHSGIPRKPVIDEDWLVTDFAADEVLVFKPYSAAEVDDAVNQLQGCMRGSPRSTSRVVIEEECPTPASTCSGTTLGADADSVLGQSLPSLDLDSSQVIELEVPPATRSTAVSAGPPNEQMNDLLRITSKLLKRPGLQKEVFKCMLEDEEVRELMLKQSRNIDAYLTAVGIHNPNLLPAPDAAPSFATAGLYRAVAEAGEEVEQEGEGRGLLQAILDAVAACIDKTGSALAGLGGWLRTKVTSLAAQLNALFGDDAEEQQAAGKTQEGDGEAGAEQERGRHAGDVVLGAVMVVVVAVTCVLMARRPVLLAASAAAVAVTHQVVSTAAAPADDVPVAGHPVEAAESDAGDSAPPHPGHPGDAPPRLGHPHQLP